jgi:osmoprotectant transport system permease protein
MELVQATATWLADPAHWQGPGGIPTRVLEHLVVCAISMLLALALGLPLGLGIGHTGRGVRLAVGLANLGRAVPTLAVIAVLVPITTMIDPQLGFNVYPTVLAMILLALPPILVNAYTAVSNVDRELVEAARGMGLRERQILLQLEVPVSLPAIAAGVRSAAVQIIATATLGAIFGLGGLGRYLVDGIAQQDDGQIWTGVLLVSVLVLLSEGGFALLQRRLTSPGLRVAGARPASTSAA